jgi:TIR domain
VTEADLRNDLFRMAMDALVELPVRERRAAATRAVSLAADTTNSQQELERIVGSRASVALRTRVANVRRIQPVVVPWSPRKSPRIAISTAEETLTQAKQLRTELVRLKARIWLYDRIPLGRRVLDEAERAMTTHDYVVLMASPDPGKSEWVDFEMALVQSAEFHDRRDRLLPVRIGMRARDLRPFLRLPRSVDWDEAGGAIGVAREIWERVEADRREIG